MQILCVQHTDFETPGIIETWAEQRKHIFLLSRPYRGEDVFEHQFDGLIVMGGPQSSVELAKDPYLYAEIEVIQRALRADRPVLGFCLGAQLIGEALGARAARSPEKEVGVYPIHLTAAGMQDPLLQGLPSMFPVTHWHNDMPGLTPESTVLADSPGCPRQIVRYRKNVYGFQCHLEITRDGVQTMIQAFPGDFKPSRYTQSPAEMLKQDYVPMNAALERMLDRLFA